ncbi:AI-2E family transporter [Adhaeretor mobilis]|uniref:Pheromone autoinducer 2 transporter n=1 Tax=Adhaeretor mobilis TaxID=1930276 RepID=A0A517MX72_9BACT|nr:AI-2E family transporter [Adhaeretor mobilis]QDS99482.1 pheromone autoinducer 2 transporter [Adhaeretor mobilis]
MNSDDKFLPHAAKLVGLSLIALVCVVVIGAALVRASDIFLILFLGVLFGILLVRTSRTLASYTPLPYFWSLGIVTATLVLAATGGIAMFGVQVDDQIDKARERADKGVEQIQAWAEKYPSVESLLLSTPFLRQLVDKRPSASQEDSNSDKEQSSQAKAAEQNALRTTARKGATAIAGIFKTTFGLVVNSVLIFFVGLFIAVEPGEYRDGVVSLFPTDRRERAREVLNLMGDALWHWLLGRFGTMLITGLGAGLLLFLLGVPMAFTLGVVTALLTFIPNIGGFVSLLLAILFALPQGGSIVLLVIVGYVGLQLVESYVLTPVIQKKQVSLPPALLIAFQAVMGVLFGFLGAAVASPALAAAKVGIEEAYIKDVLEASR